MGWVHEAELLPPGHFNLEHDQLHSQGNQTLPCLGHMTSPKLKFPGAGGEVLGRMDTGRDRNSWQR